MMKRTRRDPGNMRLNQMWRKASCALCGGKYPDVLLNIEAHIHHNSKIECLDRKSCNRRRRKKKDKTGG